MFSYAQKDRSLFSSSDSSKTAHSPSSVHSSPFSRATTPATTAHNTPLRFKEMEVNAEFQFGSTAAGAAAAAAAQQQQQYPGRKLASPMDLEKYIHDLTDESSSASPASTATNDSHTHESQPSVRSVSPFHLTTSIWDSVSSSASSSGSGNRHSNQESVPFSMEPPAKPMATRTNSLSKNSLSIDIGQANASMVTNPIRSAFMPSANSNLAVQSSDHRRKLSATESIWGSASSTSFTPTSEFFGKSITSNDINSLNNGLNLLNLKPEQPQQHLKSPLLASFNHKHSLSNAGSNADMFSPSRNAFFSSSNANASIPRSNSLFATAPQQVSPPQPQQLGAPVSMAQVLGYFSKAEDSQVQQLCLDDLKTLNYDKVFSSKAGQLPRFLLPGQDAGMPDVFGNPYQNNSHLLVLVSFKNGRLDIFYHALSGQQNAFNSLKVGDLVFVEADRGKDLGMVASTDISIDDARLIKMIQYEEQNDALRFDQTDEKNNSSSSSSNNNNNATPPQPHIPKQVLRIALPHEVAQISHKQSDELKAMTIMQSKLAIHKVPMKVLGAEYQWDRRKLTFYYVANKRIDFRDLVKDIFRIYKTRIWMCAVTPTDMSIKDTIVDESSFVQQPQFQSPEKSQLLSNSNVLAQQPATFSSGNIRHETRDSSLSNGSDYLNVPTNPQVIMNNGSGNYSYNSTPVTSTFAFNSGASNNNSNGAIPGAFNQHVSRSSSISGLQQQQQFGLFGQQYQAPPQFLQTTTTQNQPLATSTAAATQIPVFSQPAFQVQQQQQQQQNLHRHQLNNGLTASVWNA